MIISKKETCKLNLPPDYNRLQHYNCLWNSLFLSGKRPRKKTEENIVKGYSRSFIIKLIGNNPLPGT